MPFYHETLTGYGRDTLFILSIQSVEYVNTMQALLIDTGKNVEEREYVLFAMRHAGLQVQVQSDFGETSILSSDKQYDIIAMLDNRPKLRQTLVANVRQYNQNPLILITDPLSEDDHCTLLDKGVDMVFIRPLSMRLFTRYIQIFFNRSRGIPMSVLSTITADYLSLDPTQRTVRFYGEHPQRLTQLEFRLLYVLMTNQGQVIPTDELVERVWGYNGDGNRDLVRGLVRRLRKKIEPNLKQPFFIHNLPGTGYKFSTNEPPKG